MSYKPRWSDGSWNVICDQCGRKFKESQLQLRWDGLMVCQGDWEPRQPQDFVHGVADKQAPPWVRSEQQDLFLPVCTPLTSQGIADYGTADCAAADIDRGYRPDPYVCTPTTSQGLADIGVADCSRADIMNTLSEVPTIYSYTPINAYPALAG